MSDAQVGKRKVPDGEHLPWMQAYCVRKKYRGVNKVNWDDWLDVERFVRCMDCEDWELLRSSYRSHLYYHSKGRTTREIEARIGRYMAKGHLDTWLEQAPPGARMALARASELEGYEDDVWAIIADSINIMLEKETAA